MNSLLERLRRRLRELARPLDDVPSSDGSRQASRVHSGEAPERRTEIETTRRPQASDRTIRSDEASLPAQQPLPPASTRLKAAVFSKRRQPGPPRQAGTIWGPTSFLDMGASAAGDEKGARSPLELLGSAPVVTRPGLTPDVMTWLTRPSPATPHPFGASADLANQRWWSPAQPAIQADPAESPTPTWVGATALGGAPSLAPNADTCPQAPESQHLDLHITCALPTSSTWHRE